jgi:toxin ParE1/3/4
VKLRWTARALRDLKAIGRYIADDDPNAARRWVARLQARAREASINPKAGRVVPEFGRDDLREVFVGTYRIVYRLSKVGIQVLTVFEGHRLMPASVEADED